MHVGSAATSSVRLLSRSPHNNNTYHGIPPQHAPLGPPSSYYGGQEPHHKYHENGHHPPHHENFSDFVTLVCQETAQHQAAHHTQAHQAAHHLRSPYAGYAPPLPPVSSSATASHRANIGRTHDLEPTHSSPPPTSVSSPNSSLHHDERVRMSSPASSSVEVGQDLTSRNENPPENLAQ